MVDLIGFVSICASADKGVATVKPVASNAHPRCI